MPRPPPKKPRPTVLKLNQQSMEMLADLSNGMLPAEVAERYKVDASVVAHLSSKFSTIIANKRRVEEFRKNRADILAAAQQTVLESTITPSKLKVTGLYNGVRAAKLLHDMERLEQGKSTSNLGILIGSIDIGALSPQNSSIIDHEPDADD